MRQANRDYKPRASYLSPLPILDLTFSILAVRCAFEALTEVMPTLVLGRGRLSDTRVFPAPFPLPSSEPLASLFAFLFFLSSSSETSVCCSLRHRRTSLSFNTHGRLRISRRKSRILSQKSTSCVVDKICLALWIFICF